MMVVVRGGGRGGGKRGRGVWGEELTSTAKCHLEMSQAYLTSSMRAIMPEAMGAAAEVPEKDCVQPLCVLASVVTCGRVRDSL